MILLRLMSGWRSVGNDWPPPLFPAVVRAARRTGRSQVDCGPGSVPAGARLGVLEGEEFLLAVFRIRRADRPSDWKGGRVEVLHGALELFLIGPAARGGCLAGVSAACACAAVHGTDAGMVGFVGAFPAEALSATASVLK